MIPTHRMFSEPVEINFNGLRGRTDELQRYGWELSAEQDIMRDTIRIAGRHPHTDIKFITEVERWHYWRDYWRPLPSRSFQVAAWGQNVFLRVDGLPNFNFQPIDAMPQWREYSTSRLEDLVHFAPIETKQIILPEDDINTLLEKALKLQEPARMERAKARVRGQLISIS